MWQVVGIIPLLFCLLSGFAALGLGSCYMDINIVVLVLMGLDLFLIDTLTFTVIISNILAHKIQPLEQHILFERIHDTILRGSYQLQITRTGITTPAADKTTRHHHHSAPSRILPQLADNGKLMPGIHVTLLDSSC